MSRDGPRHPPDWTDCHFALFVLVDISTEEMNKILQTSFSGANLNSWNLWLADTYPTAPRKRDGVYIGGSKPPIAENWISPFIGQSISDAATFIKGLPDDATVDWHHFVVIDEDYLRSGIVNLCRIGDEELEGEELEVLPCSVEHSTLALMGLEPHGWEEDRSNVEAGYTPI